MSSASAQLDSQVIKMQESEDELQGVNAKVSAIREDIKAKLRRLEAVRSQRAELEKIRSSKVDDVEDPRYAGLYDWFVPLLVSIHKGKGSLLAKVYRCDRSSPVNSRVGDLPRRIRERATAGI